MDFIEENQQEYPELTEEQLHFLEKERGLHLAGKTKSYTREEVNEIIKARRNNIPSSQSI
ncbi:hypothetical protein [Mucilaginibacter oryzae]|uniref:hypothetical protein n=1 Tax=Mucilaginibacter oryzae TaxID=468058 RepID=UPI000D6C259B|nr:hypothetical protein [Mucilaginibacter oryzae]